MLSDRNHLKYNPQWEGFLRFCYKWFILRLLNAWRSWLIRWLAPCNSALRLPAVMVLASCPDLWHEVSGPKLTCDHGWLEEGKTFPFVFLCAYTRNNPIEFVVVCFNTWPVQSRRTMTDMVTTISLKPGTLPAHCIYPGRKFGWKVKSKITRWYLK